MKVIERMIEPLFETKPDGTVVYYGRGMFRRGYVVNDPTLRKKLYAFHYKTFAYVLPVGVLYALLLGIVGAPVAGMVPIVVAALWLHLKHRALVKDLPLHEEKLSALKMQERLVSAFPMWFIAVIFVNGAVATLVALALPFVIPNEAELVAVLSGVLLMTGVPLAAIGWLLYKKKKRL